ncbi:MAG: hypothetical protein AseanaTS_26510 [Candidatus Pelagadaptatus aseana]|uniref:putative metalloprotease CJM1_0395 family protein n=1 Tax=Candidatus Pelagadaptatus aseana TaxID=3120508 RepID=UPI0039B2BA74
MINSNNIPSNFANAVSPFSSLGSRPVGEESPDARNTPFKPVEESSETGRIQTRRDPDERGDVERQRQAVQERNDDAEGNGGRDRQQAAQDRAVEQQESADQREIDRLAARDREVRAHEQAHKSAGGSLAGAATYQYERGPDGVSYAVAGEVPIKLSTNSGDPEQALDVARRVQRAALAPAEPSVQDRQVAAQAAQLEQQALQDIAALAREEEAQRQAEVALEREQRLEEESERESSNREEERALAERERLERNNRLQETQAESAERFFDINQRLLDIGVNQQAPEAGSLIDRNI